MASSMTRRILLEMKASGVVARAAFEPGTALTIVHHPGASLERRYTAELAGREVVHSSTQDAIRRWVAGIPGVVITPSVALCAPQES